MFPIILLTNIVLAAALILIYFLGKELRIREMPELPDGWDFNKEKKQEQKMILLTGDN